MRILFVIATLYSNKFYKKGKSVALKKKQKIVHTIMLLSLLLSIRGIHLDYWINFKSTVSGGFKVGSCIHVAFSVIVNSYLNLGQTRLGFKVG